MQVVNNSKFGCSQIYKVFICAVLLMMSLQVNAQRGSAKNYNYLDYQQKPYYFGITLASNYSTFKVDHSESFILNDGISVNYGQGNLGLTFQGIANLKIGDYFDFRMLAGFSLSERSLNYYRPGESTPYDIKKIEFVYVDVPMLIRYKSSPYKDKRVFVTGGVKYTYDVNGFSKARQAENIVTISPHDFSLELGAGVQMFFPFFIFSPEVKISQGIGNILHYNKGLNEANVIDRLLSRTFTLSLHFEG